MAKRTNRIQKNTAVLNAIRKALPENTHALVVEMATDVESNYNQLAPRDSGSMAESAYVQMQDGAYQNGQKTSVSAIEAQARALNPDVEIAPLPTPTNDTTAYVAPLAAHWIFNELGTTRMAARPTLTTARAIAASNLKSKHKDALLKVVTDGRR